MHNLTTNKFILGTAQFGKPYGISNNKKLSKNIILDILNISKCKISELDTAEDYDINKSIKKKLNFFKVNTKVHISFLNNSYDQLEKKLNKIEVHARSIFLQGLAFSNKELLIQRFKKYSKKILSLQKLSKKKNFSLPSLCISHVFNKRYVSRVIFGIVDLKQLNLILNFKYIRNTSFLKVYNTTNESLIDPRKWLNNN